MKRMNRSIEDLLREIEQSGKGRNFVWKEIIEAKPGIFSPFPDDLHHELADALRRRGIEKLYHHQAEAFRLVAGGKHVVIVTPTASGKTLAYNLPVLNEILLHPSSRALYLFPTKALSQDQVAELMEIRSHLSSGFTTFTYDGDTPADARKKIRERGNIVVTNPDMLHQGILPHHTRWDKFFRNLKFVVIDELHTYRGVFGSHFGNLLRRLRRITRFYGTSPVFIMTSATIANPGELASRLLEEEVEVIDRNGAPSGKKYFYFYNPPIIDRELGIRRSALKESTSLARKFIENGFHTIVFAHTRLHVEIMVKYLKASLEKQLDEYGMIRGYRGGYLPGRRREIEEGLRRGDVKGVVATNALELGIDIGSLDVSIMAGFPGSIASTWQQAGRAGRKQKSSVAILVATSSPIDQFLMNHPDYFFSRDPERALINPDNLLILMDHLKCAAFELPFDDGEKFGNLDVLPMLQYLEDEGVLFHRDGRWFWMSDSYPANQVSLRQMGDENFTVIDITGAPRVIAEVDYFSAPRMLYEGAIYMIESETYQVEKLDFENHKAFVKKANADYYTDAIDYSRLKVLDVFTEEGETFGAAGIGEVQVITNIAGFKKIKFFTSENVGYGDVHLPDIELHTNAFWLTMDDTLMEETKLDPLKFIEAVHGIGYALKNISSLFAMCDVRDLSLVVSDREGAWNYQEGPGGNQFIDSEGNTTPLPEKLHRPTIFIYENYPGGVGISEELFKLRHSVIEETRNLIERCGCERGCPSCVGPVTYTENNVKENALKVLSFITGDG